MDNTMKSRPRVDTYQGYNSFYMWFAALLVAVLSAATTVLGQQKQDQTVAYIYSGIELIQNLEAEAGPDILQLANDYTLLTASDFTHFTVPVVIKRNVIIQGRPNRWATLNATHVARKMRLGNGTTLVMRWVVLLDFADQVSGGASTELMLSMPVNETGTLALESAAYRMKFCYPPRFVGEFLGGASQRPSSRPGVNQYNATAQVNSTLRAMGGGIGGFADTGNTSGVVCTNDMRAPQMRYCWAHVAYLEEFITYGGSYDVIRTFVLNGILLELRDCYYLCEAVLDDVCLSQGPYACLVKMVAASSAAAASGGGDETVNAALQAPPDPGGAVEVAAQADGSQPALGGGGKGGMSRSTAVVIGVVIGGVGMGALVGVLVFVVLVRRRRRHVSSGGRPKGLGSQHSNRVSGSMMGDGSSSGLSPVDEVGTPVPRSLGHSGGGAGCSVAKASGGAGIHISDCDMESDLAGRPSRTIAGTSPASSDLLSGMSCKNQPSPPLPSGHDVRHSLQSPASPPNGLHGRQLTPLDAHQQQQHTGKTMLTGGTATTTVTSGMGTSGTCTDVAQTDATGSAGSAGGGSHYPHVVVTPFTPLRPDLELWQDPAQMVTLLPVVRGKGSYGKVCEGIYGGQRVAVKLMREMLAGNSASVSDKILTTFAQEVEVLGRCRHANVVRLLAACMQPPRLCLVMELMEASLQRLIFGHASKRLLPLQKVLHIGCEIARALEYLHPTVVHRDLKPDNVLISNADSPEPIVKVSDFGLSRLRCTVNPTLHPEAGTPSYMAPECFDLYVSCITHHVDIYSWAVVMWTMLTGVEPWTGCGVVEIAYRVTLLDERLMLDDLVASGRCPRRLQRLMTRCWNRTPERRPAAAEVVKEMLLIMQQQERPVGGDLDGNYMSSPGSVLSRIREYQDAAAAAAAAAPASLSYDDASTATVAATPSAASAPASAAAKAAAAEAAAGAATAGCSELVTEDANAHVGVPGSPVAAAGAVAPAQSVRANGGSTALSGSYFCGTTCAPEAAPVVAIAFSAADGDSCAAGSASNLGPCAGAGAAVAPAVAPSVAETFAEAAKAAEAGPGLPVGVPVNVFGLWRAGGHRVTPSVGICASAARDPRAEAAAAQLQVRGGGNPHPVDNPDSMVVTEPAVGSNMTSCGRTVWFSTESNGAMVEPMRLAMPCAAPP